MNSTDIFELESQIKSFSSLNDPFSYYQIAKLHKRIYELNQNDNELSLAIQSISKCIELDESNHIFYCFRSNVSLLSKKYPEAVSDLIKAQEIILKEKSLSMNVIESKSLMIDIMKNEEIKNEINRLKIENKLTNQFVKYYDTFLDFLKNTKFPDQCISKGKSLAGSYELKAIELKKIEKYFEAIDCLTNAIKLKPNQVTLLAQRAELYGIIGNADKALDDIKKISELPDQDINGVGQLKFKNTMNDIKKLEVVNQKIKEMRNDPSINSNIIDAIEGLSVVTSNLNFKVGIHEGRLDKHDEEIDRLKESLSKCQNFMDVVQKSSNEELLKMQNQINATTLKAYFLEENYKRLESRVTDLEEFKNKFPQKYLKYIGEEKEFEEKLNNLTDQERKNIMDYVEGFIYQCTEVYTASLIVTSGKFSLNISNTLVSLGSQLLSFLPFIGDKLSEGVKVIYEEIESIKIKTKSENVVRFSPSNNEFERNIRSIIYKTLIDEKKQRQIINEAKIISDKWYEKIKEIIQELTKLFKDFIQENKANKFNNPQYLYGKKQAQEILDKFILNGNILELENQGCHEIMSELLKELVKNEDVVNQENIEIQIDQVKKKEESKIEQDDKLKDVNDENKEQTQEVKKDKNKEISCCVNCSVFTIKVKYDYVLLNNLHNLTHCINYFGFEQVISNLNKIPREIIVKSLQEKDETIIHGYLKQHIFEDIQ